MSYTKESARYYLQAHMMVSRAQLELLLKRR